MADRHLRSSYKHEIPPSAQEKFRLLQDRRATAAYLEAQLSKARAEVAELEEELAPFRIEDRAMDTSKTIPSINQLPVEILCLIFQRYLISRHPSIRILLLVCKRWNQIISTNPWLWARIEVGDAFELFDFYDEKSRLPYISACIERSGDALLDVDLDMRTLLTRGEYIKTEMERVALSLLEHDEIGAALDSIDEQSYTAISPFPQLHAAIQLLIGQDDSSLKRWRTLRIQFGYKTQTWVIWEALTGDTTNLTTIHLERVPRGWLDESERPSLVDVDLSRIQHMSLDEAIPLHHFSVSPKVLQHLEISVDFALKSIEKLSSFPLLSTLELYCGKDHDENESPKVPAPSLFIHLPQLKKLVISGKYSRLKWINFDLPVFQLLVVRTVLTDVYQLPKLSPQHIHWKDQYPTFGGEDRAIKAINTLVLLSKSIRTLTVGKEHRTSLLKTVTLSKAKRWLKFIFGGRNGWRD